MNPQEDRLFFFFGGVAAAMSSLQVTSHQPCHADAGLCDGGHLWLRFSCSFSLMRRNRRIKADIIGPNTQSGRFPAMSAVARTPDQVKVWRSRTPREKSLTYSILEPVQQACHPFRNLSTYLESIVTTNNNAISRQILNSFFKMI